MVAQAAPGFAGIDHLAHGPGIAGQCVAVAGAEQNVAGLQAPGLGVLLGQMHDFQQVIETDVQVGIDLTQGVIEIFRGQVATVGDGLRLARQDGRITAPGEQAVEQHGDQQDHPDIEQYRAEHEGKSQFLNGRTADYCTERRSAAGRVDAACILHGQNGQRYGQCRRERRARQQLLADHPDQRRQAMPTDYRPRLRKRAVGYDEQQHGACAH